MQVIRIDTLSVLIPLWQLLVLVVGAAVIGGCVALGFRAWKESR